MPAPPVRAAGIDAPGRERLPGFRDLAQLGEQCEIGECAVGIEPLGLERGDDALQQLCRLLELRPCARHRPSHRSSDCESRPIGEVVATLSNIRSTCQARAGISWRRTPRAMSWLPDGFIAPARLDLRTGHHLRPIREPDVDLDYPAVMGSRNGCGRCTATRGDGRRRR